MKIKDMEYNSVFYCPRYNRIGAKARVKGKDSVWWLDKGDSVADDSYGEEDAVLMTTTIDICKELRKLVQT